ncbi:MAG: phosphatidate cytidylyltransferase [Gammaproteobacteria bacterium]|jgi:phosphatidate cytidylyltransferase|nr:phosphatidate cytidylyltransferase [Gammaproteobacteria bacterium]
MLKTRVLTALVMVTLGLTCVFALPPAGFSLVAALILLLLGGWEAARLAGFDAAPARWCFGLALCLAAAGIHAWSPRPDPTLAMACLLWLFNLAWLARPEAGRSTEVAIAVGKLTLLAIVLTATWLGLSVLQARSPWLVLQLLIIIAAADTGAYFSGRHFGGTKLAPRISPGKTRAGAIGGLVGAALLTPLLSLWIPGTPFDPALTAFLALGLALISIGGDLFMSLLKRHRGLKDASALFPGHGGVLDRFDSMTAVVPFYTLAVLYLSSTGAAP